MDTQNNSNNLSYTRGYMFSRNELPDVNILFPKYSPDRIFIPDLDVWSMWIRDFENPLVYNLYDIEDPMFLEGWIDGMADMDLDFRDYSINFPMFGGIEYKLLEYDIIRYNKNSLRDRVREGVITSGHQDASYFELAGDYDPGLFVDPEGGAMKKICAGNDLVGRGMSVGELKEDLNLDVDRVDNVGMVGVLNDKDNDLCVEVGDGKGIEFESNEDEDSVIVDENDDALGDDGR